MVAGMILAGISGREHGSGSKRSFPIRKRANASATNPHSSAVNGACTKPYLVWTRLSTSTSARQQSLPSHSPPAFLGEASKSFIV